MMKKGYVLKIIGFSFLVKIIYLALSIGLFNNGILKENYQFDVDSYIEMASKKDAAWYQKIAKSGYSEIAKNSEGAPPFDFKTRQSEWAFFPFYPFLNKYTAQIFDIDYGRSALLWSYIFSTLALLGFYLFSKLFWEEVFVGDLNKEQDAIPLKNKESVSQKAFYSTLIFGLFPFHFYTSLFLTEGVFFTFLIFSFITIHRRKYGLTMLLLLPLVLTRPNGVIMLIPLYLYFLERKQLLPATLADWKKLFVPPVFLGAFIFIPAGLLFLWYCYYQGQMTGYYFAFSKAQAGWGKEFMFPLAALFRKGNFAYQFNSWYTILAILFIFKIYRKLPLSLNILIVFSFLLPMSSGSVYSMARYLSVCFPITLILAELCYNSAYKVQILIFLGLAHLLTFYWWLQDYPVGY